MNRRVSFFFFSSRRRHTRFDCDWSSDVCSSDLVAPHNGRRTAWPGTLVAIKSYGSALDPLWFKDAIIYETHVKAFFDSDNDGIGDFKGLTTKLDYLQELGVTCLWLLPFFPSPLRDDGYDISDYAGLHPSYGTL